MNKEDLVQRLCFDMNENWKEAARSLSEDDLEELLWIRR